MDCPGLERRDTYQEAGVPAKVPLDFDGDVFAHACVDGGRRGGFPLSRAICKFGRPRFLYCCFIRLIVNICESFASAQFYNSRKRFCSSARNRHSQRRVCLSITKFHIYFISPERVWRAWRLAMAFENVLPIFTSKAEAHEGRNFHLVPVFRTVIHQSTGNSWPQADVVSFEKNLLLSQVKLKHCR